MKKIFKKLLFLTLATTMAFSFSACSDDDDDEGVSASQIKSLIVGSWESVEEDGGYGINVNRITFRADGTCKTVSWYEDYETGMEDYETFDYTYTINGDKINLVEVNGDDRSTAQVLSINENTMKLKVKTEKQTFTFVFTRMQSL